MTIDQLLSAHLEHIGTNIERWLELFAVIATVEFPVITAFGMEAKQ